MNTVSSISTLQELNIFDYGYKTMTQEIFQKKNEGSIAVFELADEPKDEPDFVSKTGDKYWFCQDGLFRSSFRWSNDDQSIAQSFWCLNVAGLNEWYPAYDNWVDNDYKSEQQMCGYTAWNNMFLLKQYSPADFLEYPLGHTVSSLPFVMFKQFFFSGIKFALTTGEEKFRTIRLYEHPNHSVYHYGMVTLQLQEGRTFFLEGKKTKTLTIIDGPDQGDFDMMINYDDYSRRTSFNTKESNWCSVYCTSVGIDQRDEQDVSASGADFVAMYNSTTKTGKLIIEDRE